jgi:tetratricopeptide (TPR) repeat protein
MNNISQLHKIAEQAINQRDYQLAHQSCLKILEIDQDHADAYFLLGIINSEIGQINKAIQLFNKAVALKSTDEYLVHLCKCYALQGNMNAALVAAEKINVEQLNHALNLDTLGVALSRIGLHHRALKIFEKALSINDHSPAFYYNYAVSAKFAGLFAQAREAFERAIALKPDYYQAHFALSDLGENQNHVHQVARLLALNNPNLHPDATLHIGHALAKEYEARGLYNDAFAALSNAKDKKLATINYQFVRDQALFTAAKSAINLANQGSASSDTGYPDPAPIFVVGMPRSGTTLVERILSNHSDVDSCGELQDFGLAVKELAATTSPYVLDLETLQKAQQLDMQALGQRYLERTQAVRQGAKRFVDKLPFNFFYIGLILQALPKAKIIFVQRNPMDTCIGNFRQLFSINSPYYAYSFNLLNIARFYLEFHRLGQYWQQLQSANVYHLRYETLAQEPEIEVQKLLKFCDLDWQAQCVNVESNTAPVSTASKVQVREPINTSSIGRWKKYADSTNELQQFFKDHGIPF